MVSINLTLLGLGTLNCEKAGHPAISEGPACNAVPGSNFSIRRVRSVPSIEELRNEIVSLEERALYMADLANCIPEHQDWLWRSEERLTDEAERLKRLLAEEESRCKTRPA